MPKGSIAAAEGRTFRDPDTGARIRQVTDHPSIHHHPFFFVPCFDDAMRRLVLVSHRTGAPQIFAESRADGTLTQLTDRDDLAEWSLHPSHDGRHVFFVAGTCAWRIDTTTFVEECLADFGSVEMRERGMVGAAMGTTALSHDDRHWAVPVKAAGVSRLHMVDTERGGSRVILEAASIGHPQFHPSDADLLFYAGPLVNRIWCVSRDGSRHWNPYPRSDRTQWITHETWIPGTRELAFVDWPRGMLAVDVDSGRVRALTRFPAWHAIFDPAGRRIVCDTTFPDIGIHLIAPDGGLPQLLCQPRASNVGQHWGGPFPYNDGPREVYAPQHTHPHPRFSPDGTRVIYTSDAGGHAQIFECILEGPTA